MRSSPPSVTTLTSLESRGSADRYSTGSISGHRGQGSFRDFSYRVFVEQSRDLDIFVLVGHSLSATTMAWQFGTSRVSAPLPVVTRGTFDFPIFHDYRDGQLVKLEI